VTTYSVVGCRECDYLWIVEDLRKQQTASCPRCDHTRQTGKFKTFSQSDDAEEVAEDRSRLLAKRAGCLEEFVDGNDEYWILEERIQEQMSAVHDVDDKYVEDRLGICDDEFGELAEAYLESDRVRKRSIYADEVEEHFERRFATLTADDGDSGVDERPPCEIDGAGGSITPTTQTTLGVATVDLDGTITEVNKQLASTPAFKTALVDGLQDAGEEIGIEDLADRFEQAGVVALPAQSPGAEESPLVADIARQVAKGHNGATVTLLRLLQELGDRTHLNIQSSVQDIFTSYPRLFAAIDATPTIGVRVTRETLDELDASQRRTLCTWLSELARGCDVRLHGKGATLRVFAQKHRGELPAAVSEGLNARRDESAESLARDARAALWSNQTATDLLRALEDEQDHRMPYEHLQRRPREVSESRVRQLVVSDDDSLADLGLVTIVEIDATRHVELTDAGREYLALVDEEVGRQQRLDDAVSDPQKSSDNSRESTHTRGGREAGTPDRNRLPLLHQVTPRDEAAAYAAAYSPPTGGIAVTDHPVEENDDRAEPAWYHDRHRDRLVVGAEADNPMQWWVCVARALANWRTFEYVATEDRLADESHQFAQFLDGAREELRESRCLGYLSDEDVQEPADYIDALGDAESHLCDLTSNYHNGEYECSESQYRGLITREALGLYGTMVHLLDLVDIDIVLEMRLPNANQNMTANRRRDLCLTLATGLAIGSKYDNFATFGQLYETRPEKIPTLGPDVDMDAPAGEVIPSVSIVGRFNSTKDRFVDALRTALSNPRDLREDAPEFSVSVPLRTEPRHDAYSRVVKRLCDKKRLKPTHEATTLLRALTGTPYDVAAALMRLSPEDGRAIRLDEVRVALQEGLSPDRILPDHTPTVGKVVWALLTASGPLSTSAVAEEAGCSPQSVRNNAEALAALDLVRRHETANEVRFSVTLPSSSSGDRCPEPVSDSIAAAQDYVYELVAGLDADRDAAHAAVSWPPDWEPLLSNSPGIEPWVELARRLCANPDPDPVTVSFGQTPDGQVGLETAVARGATADD